MKTQLQVYQDSAAAPVTALAQVAVGSHDLGSAPTPLKPACSPMTGHVAHLNSEGSAYFQLAGPESPRSFLRGLASRRLSVKRGSTVPPGRAACQDGGGVLKRLRGDGHGQGGGSKKQGLPHGAEARQYHIMMLMEQLSCLHLSSVIVARSEGCGLSHFGVRIRAMQ